MFGVGFDDIGPAAIEHGQHVGQDFVHHGIQVVDLEQRKQRLRKAVQPEQQVIDALLFLRIHHFGRRVDHPEIARQQHSPVVGDLFAQQFPVAPYLSLRPLQRIEAFGAAPHPDRGEGVFPVGRSYHLPELFVGHFARSDPQQVAEPFRNMEHAAVTVGLPPTDFGIPHNLPQDLIFFHSQIFCLPTGRGVTAYRANLSTLGRKCKLYGCFCATQRAFLLYISGREGSKYPFRSSFGGFFRRADIPVRIF